MQYSSSRGRGVSKEKRSMAELAIGVAFHAVVPRLVLGVVRSNKGAKKAR